MSVIKLHKIKIENFRSIIEPLTLSFPDNGIIRFRGKNGAGKTSVIEALYFVLFDDSLKPGGTIQSSLTGESARVTLTFSIGDKGYKIERTPKTVALSELDLTVYKPMGLYKADTNKLIVELLGMTPMQFQNAIVMASASRRLADYTEPERREFFKTLFNMDWIDTLRSKVETDYKRIKAEIEKTNATIQGYRMRLDTAERSFANYSKFQEEANSVYAQTIEVAQAIHDEAVEAAKQLSKPVEPDLADMTELNLSLTVARNTTQEFMYELARGNTDIAARKRETKKKPEPIATECPYCGTPYDETATRTAQATYEAALAEYSLWENEKANRLTELEAKMDVARANHKKAKDEESALEIRLQSGQSYNKQLQQDYQAATAKYTIASEKVLSTAKALETAKLAKPKYYTQYIHEASVEVAECKSELSLNGFRLDSLNEELKAADFWYKDALSPNGIKAYVTQALFNKLNIALGRYSKLFGLAVKFNIDPEATYTKTSLIVARQDGVVIPYGDLSQGQVTRVQLTLQLGLFDLIANDRWNLMLIDEPFLGLDIDACQSIMELLPLLAKDRAIFVIDQQLGEFPNTQTYEFELVDRKTVMR